MLNRENIIARKDRMVLLLKKGIVTKYYRGEYDKSYYRIRNKYSINKSEANILLRKWKVVTQR